MNITKNEYGWKIEDSKGNYLTYTEYHKTAKACYGVVDNITIKSQNGRNWMKKGRGKISETTWSKIIEMNEYFYSNY
jgi:hypothetical protein